MTKIKGMEDHGLLQMIIRIILPPPCSSVPLQMVTPDDQNQEDGGAGIFANDYLEDPASSSSAQTDQQFRS